MRIRRRPWARPELSVCPFYIQNPQEYIGKWKTLFKNDNKIHLELGCGKGGFISQTALKNPDINYIAVDIKSDMLGMAKRKIEKLYKENGKKVDNVLLTALNIEKIDEIFNDDDKVSRIYINFCNPWPKAKHKKHRLTYTKVLKKYKIIMNNETELWFKTDDDMLFEESITYFSEAGYKITFITRNLHESNFTENIMTEHEQMFIDMGKKIKFLIAKPENIPDIIDD